MKTARCGRLLLLVLFTNLTTTLLALFALLSIAGRQPSYSSEIHQIAIDESENANVRSLAADAQAVSEVAGKSETFRETNMTPANVFPEIDALDDEGNAFSAKDRQPVGRFVYFKLHKTGSSATINNLHIFDVCKNYQICCLTTPEFHNIVNHCKASGEELARKATVERCSQAVQVNFTKFGLYGTYYTPYKLRACNPAMADYIEQNGVHGIAAHVPLHTIGGNRQFLRQITNLTAVFSFTIIRSPVDQFLSFAQMFDRLSTFENQDILGRNRHSMFLRILHHVGNLTKLIHNFHARTVNASHPLSWHDQQRFKILTNSQSKELGWDGRTEESLAEVIKFARSLSFIGTFERLQDSWLSLQSLMDWPDQYRYNSTDPKTLPVSHGKALRAELPISTINAIKRIQWADQRLYEALKPVADKQIDLKTGTSTLMYRTTEAKAGGVVHELKSKR